MITPPTLLPETMAQCRRVIADGGTIIDQKFMDRVIRTMKAQGAYSSCKFLADANFAVKKDGSNAVSKLYDISGNNNDAVQATGANQPIWTAAVQNSKAGFMATGNTSFVRTAAFSSAIAQPNTTILYGKLVDTNGYMLDGAVNRQQVYITTAGAYQMDGGVTKEYTITTTTFFLTTMLWNGVASEMWKNGASLGTGNAGTASLSALTILGNSTTGGSPTNAIASGVTVFNAVLSTTQRQALESLINSYYAIY